MTESVFVNADRTKVVDEGSRDAAYKIHLKDAVRLGLVKAKKAEEPAPVASADVKIPPRATSRAPRRRKE